LFEGFKSCGRSWPLLLPLALGGCTHNINPLFGDVPYRAYVQVSPDGSKKIGPTTSMVFSSDELDSLDTQVTGNNVKDADTRNELITERMYLVDQAYYDYETKLTHDDEFVGAIGSLASFSTSAVAGAIPLAAATKTLSVVSSGITAGTSFSQKGFLLSETMQALQKQMRTDRDIQAAVIYGRMHCAYSQYPAAIAFSDLEDYARSGTLSSALLGLNKTTTQAQTQAKTAKDTAAAAAAAAAPAAAGKAAAKKAPAAATAAAQKTAAVQKAAATGLSQQLANTQTSIQNAAQCPIIPPGS
jgi:hypothetical protein